MARYQGLQHGQHDQQQCSTQQQCLQYAGPPSSTEGSQLPLPPVRLVEQVQEEVNGEISHSVQIKQEPVSEEDTREWKQNPPESMCYDPSQVQKEAQKQVWKERSSAANKFALDMLKRFQGVRKVQQRNEIPSSQLTPKSEQEPESETETSICDGEMESGSVSQSQVVVPQNKQESNSTETAKEDCRMAWVRSQLLKEVDANTNNSNVNSGSGGDEGGDILQLTSIKQEKEDYYEGSATLSADGRSTESSNKTNSPQLLLQKRGHTVGSEKIEESSSDIWVRQTNGRFVQRISLSDTTTATTTTIKTAKKAKKGSALTWVQSQLIKETHKADDNITNNQKKYSDKGDDVAPPGDDILQLTDIKQEKADDSYHEGSSAASSAETDFPEPLLDESDQAPPSQKKTKQGSFANLVRDKKGRFRHSNYCNRQPSFGKTSEQPPVDLDQGSHGGSGDTGNETCSASAAKKRIIESSLDSSSSSTKFIRHQVSSTSPHDSKECITDTGGPSNSVKDGSPAVFVYESTAFTLGITNKSADGDEDERRICDIVQGLWKCKSEKFLTLATIGERGKEPAICPRCETTSHNPGTTCPVDNPVERIGEISPPPASPSASTSFNLPESITIQHDDDGFAWVVAGKSFSKYTLFGPFIGEISNEAEIVKMEDVVYWWSISSIEDGKIRYRFLNATDERKSNWMRNIRAACHPEESNVRLVEKDGQLFFYSSRDIAAGEELVYWLSLQYVYDNSLDQVTMLVDCFCGLCPHRFLHPILYSKHKLLSHFNELGLMMKWFRCGLCKRTLIGRRQTDHHCKAVHEGGACLQCLDCKQLYKHRLALHSHRQLYHAAQKMVVCHQCGESMAHRKLHMHNMTRHTDRVPCVECDKLILPHLLTKHTKTVHSNIYSMVCDHCGKKFKDSSAMKVHLLTHSGVKPFECAEPGCSVAYTTKQCLQKHYRTQHGYTDQSMPDIKRQVPFTVDAHAGNT